MSDRSLKYIFLILLLVMLAAMVRTSRDAGISGDEEVHYRQSEMVYSYFATRGEDKSCLNTPKTKLQYYGQAFDNLVTILIHWFRIEDIYGFRHLMCTLSGWLTILVTAWMAVSVSGYAAGILAVLLFALSPTYLGHAQNNLKDIPFALAYIASIFFMVKMILNGSKKKGILYFMLILSLALAIGIRAGGLMLIGYLFLLAGSEILYRFRIDGQVNPTYIRRMLVSVFLVSLSGYLLGLILWPYALQNPVLNPWKSYLVMAHFPVSIRQIFEGNATWSDLLPWYYLPKSMLITIPLPVWAGFCLFLIPLTGLRDRRILVHAFLVFTVLFPPVFAVINHVNLYGSWRHFLFLYPGIVLLAALGLAGLFRLKKHYLINLAVGAIVVALALHPLLFMLRNHPLYYMYYNPLAGGLKNAFGRYETDYYYHSMRMGSEWLVRYLQEEGVKQAVVGANFSVAWYLRRDPGIQFRYFAWDDRCQVDWDYAVIGNSYIPPGQLRSRIWPPENAIHVVYVDSVPVCAVLKRQSWEDLMGINALKEGRTEEAIERLEIALNADPVNEVIYYYLGSSLKKDGDISKADSVLNLGLRIHDKYEPILLLLAKNARERGVPDLAAVYCDRVISENPRYYSAYVMRAALYGEKELPEARKTLKACLKINPRYKPALVALADTYRKSDPDLAAIYDKMARSIK